MIRIDHYLTVSGAWREVLWSLWLPLLLTVAQGVGLWLPSLSYLEKLCKLHFLDLQRPQAQVLIVFCLCCFILFIFQRVLRHNIGFWKSYRNSCITSKQRALGM